MKCARVFAMLLSALLFCAAFPAAFAQDTDPVINDDGSINVQQPLVVATGGADSLGIAPNPTSDPGSTTTIPLWSYNITAYDGNTYSGSIVGHSPFARGATTTNVPVVIIPLKVVIGSFTFDPTATDDGCMGMGAPSGTNALTMTQQSPVFTPTSWTFGGTAVGTGTYPDITQRAAFWQTVSKTGNAYHLAFSPITMMPLQTITYTSTNSTVSAVFGIGGSPCGSNPGPVNQKARLGVVNINGATGMDAQLRGLIASLGIQPTQFPFFVLYKSVISSGAANNVNNCCILGYHSAFVGSTANPGQTYGIGYYGSDSPTTGFSDVFGGFGDITGISHEVAEWTNDPSGRNPTPAWGGLGQVSGCQNNLEVGDPMSGTLYPTVVMPNGVSYHPQEMAFFSWFFSGTGPGYGVNGWFSSNGTFAGGAKACPPGGTN